MRHALGSSKTGLVLALTLAALPVRGQEAKDSAPKPTATGTWTWTLTRPGGVGYEVVLKLQQDGEKLTGTILGVLGDEVKIQEGKVTKDGEVSFEVLRDRGDGMKFTQKYHGQLKGDTIKGKVEAITATRSQTRDWEAKRVKEEKSGGAKRSSPN